ncbi:hypothetical protein RFI_02563 [Reticulomyxa filosa]|uniref:Uncharacterized protein n=1 Tax=Reticulomyxa filosa TaxID=46433 RepID=X6PA55_RETFI|nr:hypothetical protein RFI_02563 [Reticulomyxa filosa]|eukprot:ETO34532.1 hypothetical protein RFI_02563 [Reticulomyxa filosa]
MLDTFCSSSKLLKIFHGHLDCVNNDKTVRVWYVNNNKQIQSFNKHSHYVKCVKFSQYHSHNNRQNHKLDEQNKEDEQEEYIETTVLEDEKSEKEAEKRIKERDKRYRDKNFYKSYGSVENTVHLLIRLHRIILQVKAAIDDLGFCKKRFKLLQFLYAFLDFYKKFFNFPGYPNII